ncbi:MAG: hypothetical protein HRU34_08085 [Richelia sp.]|nr:hypothetical protein [Richelia sp.]
MSSADQSTLELEALTGRIKLHDGAAYAQNKLALTMWSRSLVLSSNDRIAVLQSLRLTLGRCSVAKW